MPSPPTVYEVAGGRAILVAGLGKLPEGLVDVMQAQLDSMRKRGPGWTIWAATGPPWIVVAWRGMANKLRQSEVEAAAEQVLLAWARVEEPAVVSETKIRRALDRIGQVELPARPSVLSELGELQSVSYVGELDGDGQMFHYEHTFKKGSRPSLSADPDGQLWILGGNYTVPPQGITDTEE